jgi:parallel beta-helix repeat protein
MTRFRRAVGGVSVLALLLTLTALANPASATHVGCGQVIVTDTTLDSDVGPCPGAGLVVAADNVTLNLNGHRVIGDPNQRAQAQPIASDDAAGVVLRRVSGVTVENGTITGFDAGVAVRGGDGNTLQNLNVVDNINYRVLTGIDADPDQGQEGPRPPECDYGDGIAVFNSSNNRIDNNTVANNGPLSGIALVENSDGNVLSNNQVVDNDVLNRTRDDDPRNTICGTAMAQGPMTRGRLVQSIGIRVEGPGADANRIEGNQVHRNALTGIALHGYVCNSPNPGVPAQPNNGDNRIVGNTVTQTGLRTHGLDRLADGIASLQQGPATVVCVAHGNTIERNTSTGNFRDGINLGGRGSHDNVVSHNTVNDNVRNGLALTGPITMPVARPGAVDNTLIANRGQGNGEFDGADFNPRCDNNTWRANRFATVNQPCVLGPGASGNTPGRSGSTARGRGGEAPGQLDLNNRA